SCGLSRFGPAAPEGGQAALQTTLSMPTFARRSGPLLIVTTFAIACAGAKTTRPATSPTPAQVTVDRMIVRTAVQVVSVDSIEGTAREVERIVAGVGGSSSERTSRT